METWIIEILSIGPSIILVVILVLLLWPIKTSFRRKSHISQSYQESVDRIDKCRSLDGPEVADHGHLIFLGHGHKVDKAIVMYHGYTNCPRQYDKLAKQFFDKGYNVYVPRVPHNGLKDLTTKEIGNLTLEEIVEVCEESIDIARGLGEKVTVLGLSMGGVMASWNAQFRDDVDVVVSIVPSFGWYFLPGMIKPLINVSRLFPNMLLWWDPLKKDNRDAPYSMYHKFATRPMGDIMTLGLSVQRASTTQAPKANKLVVLTNEMDIAVDHINVIRLLKNWQQHGADVDYYQFPKTLQMEHDIIDPLHPYEQTDVVYHKIFELLDE